MTLGQPPFGKIKDSADLERPQLHLRGQVKYFDITSDTRDLLTKADPSELELLELGIATSRDINICLSKMSGLELGEWPI